LGWQIEYLVNSIFNGQVLAGGLMGASVAF
jgi:hypothetical protein